MSSLLVPRYAIHHVNKKMKDVKKAFEVLTARSANEKAKLDCARGAIKEAAHIARERQNEINVLRSEIDREKESIRVLRIESTDLKNNNTSLQKDIEGFRLKEKELEGIINKKNLEIYALQRNIETEQSKNIKSNEKFITIKKEYKNAIKRCAAMKKELQDVAVIHTEKKQTSELMQTIVDMKKSRKNLKKEIRQLLQQIKSLEEDVENKGSIIASLSKKLKRSKTDSENLEYKVAVDCDNYFHQMKAEYERELSIRDKKTTELEKQVERLLSEKTQVEKMVAIMADEVKVEKQEKLMVEKKLVAVQGSLKEQAIKTQEALKNICDRFSPPD